MRDTKGYSKAQRMKSATRDEDKQSTEPEGT